ncbi:MAG: Hsp70 family protein [Lachnospiraceae bacterium]|nr:Hsp70 family protein [Lachnospiraceae bacterium]
MRTKTNDTGYNAAEHNDLCVGIDLGTTNSVLATINEKLNGDIVSKVVEIPRAVDMYNAMSGEAKLTKMKKPTLPSCIYYRQENDYEPLVGDFAKVQYPLRSHLVARSIKSQMGSPLVEGLSCDIPDKTPAQISAQILKHMLEEASKVYRCKITDAVITVPANFDSAMCKATRDAAELAGIQVKNEDGSERPVLLSEPNAVIYDLINQIRNGEISSRILDLSEKRKVLVFDFGGGTLDITMHEIKRREGVEDVLKVDEIATNRYTLLGGDDFDEEIARAMYERYLRQFANRPKIAQAVKQKEEVVMPQMRVYAEHLKLDLNERCGEDYSSGWDDEDEEIELPVGGSMGGVGFAYDDTFTKGEVEAILSVFMAPDLVFEDHKRLAKITNTRNIIYPILDVLHKAAEKLDTDDVQVDAVIVNGGMSKFYMVTDRLREFFGFEPIVALDPDLSVARGAAVYHYYLHKYDQMQDDMRILGEEVPAAPRKVIEWGRNILNDSLYLGVKNGAVHKIIPTGAAIPYTSEKMTGFMIEPGQNKIAIPIKSQNLDGSYRIIANGNISFREHYVNGAFVTFVIDLGINKILTMKAWTSKDQTGTEQIEEGYAQIAIDNGERSKIKAKFMAPSGSVLQPKAEVNNLLQLCQNYEKTRNKQEKSTLAKRINACVGGICSASNKKEFAQVILDALGSTDGEGAKQRLFIIARRIVHTWEETAREDLAKACMRQLKADLEGSFIGGPKVSTNIQAIYTMSVCADAQQLAGLAVLHSSPKYLQACLYTHGKTQTDIPWLLEEFDRDWEQAMGHFGNNLQFSAHAIGAALRKENGEVADPETDREVADRLSRVIKSGNLTKEELACCILALGWICDQRRQSAQVGETAIQEALAAIRAVDDLYPAAVVTKSEKAGQVAVKMIQGDRLDEDEEQFLLTRLEI